MYGSTGIAAYEAASAVTSILEEASTLSYKNSESAIGRGGRSGLTIAALSLRGREVGSGFGGRKRSGGCAVAGFAQRGEDLGTVRPQDRAGGALDNRARGPRDAAHERRAMVRRVEGAGVERAVPEVHRNPDLCRVERPALHRQQCVAREAVRSADEGLLDGGSKGGGERRMTIDREVDLGAAVAHVDEHRRRPAAEHGLGCSRITHGGLDT